MNDERVDWSMRNFIDRELEAYNPENRPEIAKRFYDRGVPLHVDLRILK